MSMLLSSNIKSVLEGTARGGGGGRRSIYQQPGDYMRKELPILCEIAFNLDEEMGRVDVAIGWEQHVLP